MEDNYEETMRRIYGKNWDRAVVAYTVINNNEPPNLTLQSVLEELRDTADALYAIEEKARINVAADKPNLPSHHWDVLVSRISDVFEGVRAEHLEVKDGSLVFYAEGQVLVAYGPGTWFTVSKTAESDSI